MSRPLLLRPLLRLSQANETVLRALRFLNLRMTHRLGGFSSIPFPILGARMISSTSTKGENSEKRLQAVLDRIPEGTRQIVDIGSNNGYFALALGARGYDVIGYEPHVPFVRGAQQICDRFNLQNVGFFAKGVDVESSKDVFESDVTLVLSVFHNWVKQYGFESAVQILTNLWSKTRKVMFFELASTLDNEYIAGFDTMPSMGDTPEQCRAFMAERILGRLPGAEVEFVGLMPTDYVNGSARHFFVVRRYGTH